MRPSIIGAIILTLSFGIVVACSQPVAPSPFVPAEAGHTFASASSARSASAHDPMVVPFKGTLDGLLTMSTPLTFPLLSNLIEGSGTATHLGEFSLRMPHIVDRTTRIGTGAYEFVAANGDALVADFSGQATVIAPGVLSSVDTAVIRTGSGRFTGATGTFTVERTFVMATGQVSGSFDGTIAWSK
jgi:hypothetical protein